MNVAYRRLVPFGVSTLVAATACNPPATKPGITTDGPSSSALETATTASGSVHADAGRPSERNQLQVIEATQDTDALSLIRTRRLEARANGRVLVVYVGATWCEPCKRFKAEVRSGRLDEQLGKTTLLAFDVDKDGDRLGAAGYTYAFVPFVALPGADGRPADTQQASGRGGEAWRELLGKLHAWQRGT
ncbi:MAG TPA: hypothetical protein VM925_04385 [Labilithrix sp.]|nr:hypothetical protein [Labilithrix sp.]